MGLRTIDAPGVEIKEIDKSGYAPAMTGTKCFVMGYANKGEPYQPMEFTSKAAWQNFYGEPDNEAERYFYNACTEVMNQNGVLYCSRIPYDNQAFGKMVGFNYKVASEPKDVPTAGSYLKEKEDTYRFVKHDKDYETDAVKYIIENKLLRDIDGELSNGMELDDEVQKFYRVAIREYSKISANNRYSVEYYSFVSADSTVQNFNSRNKAEAAIAEYTEGKQDLSGKYIYVTDIVEKSDNDVFAYVLKYDFKKVLLHSEMPEVPGLTGDVEYGAGDAQKVKEYLESAPTEKFSKRDCKQFINIAVVDDGFTVEEFVTKKISQLYTELKLDPNECGYDKILTSDYEKCLLGQDQLAIRSYKVELDTTTGKLVAEKTFYTEFDQMRDDFRDSGEIKVSDLYDKYGCSKKVIKKDLKYYQIVEADKNLDKYLEIVPGGEPISYDLDKIEEYKTGEDKFTSQQFLIVDKTCATLKSIVEDTRKGGERQMIGIFPVVTTAANALYAQSLITVEDEDVPSFETITDTQTKDYMETGKGFSLLTSDIVKQYSNAEIVESEAFLVGEATLVETVSREANNYFSSIQMNPQLTGFDTENLKKIGVVVFKAYLDASEGNKVNFTPVESFVGSLDKDAKNPTTGATTFLDTIVNNQSDYIYFFSNCFATKNLKAKLDEADLFIAKPGRGGMLGFFEYETKEEMSLPTLYQGIDKCLQKVENVDERDIDIIPDAGLGNIAQYLQAMKSVWGSTIPYDIDAVDGDGNPMVKYWTCKKNEDVGAWKTVQFKYDNFCKNVRKDCMFITDGPRPMVLQGQKKIVRPTKPTNTIDANILPFVKWATGLNTNYGAGYLDWFQVADEFTGDNFWCPPSIKAMGVYINTDLNFNYWDAPAGLNRGVIAALDAAFSPTAKQAGSIYTKNWNYAINYPYDGIVLEGQKTFQVKPSAFDRVNVRRTFLRLERQTRKVARYFVYEGNTAYTRQRLIDTLDPIFYQAKVGGGLYDYKIVCDESINTPNVIDNNELKVKIGLKPTKTAEFILIDFIALSTGASFSEM